MQHVCSIPTQGTEYRQVKFLMGCLFEINVFSDDEVMARSAIEAAFGEISALEMRLSRFIETSEVSRLNKEASTREIYVSKELFNLIKKSIELSRLTRGCFDITSCQLSNLWKDSEALGKLPSHKQIVNTLYCVGWEKIKLNEEKRSIFFELSGLKIDFGAIGKGYAIEKASRILKDYGIKKAVISCGSTIYSYGDEVYRFGIQNPDQQHSMISTVDLDHEAVSTTAASDRFFTIKGKKYGHVIDPRNGRPVHKLESVSVVHASPILSDAYATAIFVGGVDKVKVIKAYDAKAKFVIVKKRTLSRRLHHFEY